MTAPATTRRAGPFNGNGVTTSFPFTFKVFATSDIAVIKTGTNGLDTTLALGSDYTVTLNPDQDSSPGGAISYSTLATGEKLTAIGALPYDQTADLPSGGNYRAIVIENALDRTVFQIQQLAEGLGRALTVSSSSAGTSTELPTPEASKLIGWNPQADGLQNFDAAVLLASVAYADWVAESFTGDGATQAFALAGSPGSIGNIDVSIAGVTQVAAADYSVSGNVLTFTSAPPNTSTIFVRYGSAAVQGTTSFISELKTATASQTVFTTSTAFTPGVGNVKVHVDGLRVTDYTEGAANTITFTSPLSAGQEVLIEIGRQLNDAIGAEQVSYTAPGGVARSAQAKMQDAVSVLDFGADPTGVESSSTAFANARATGKAVYAPAGTYRVTLDLLTGDTLFGDGPRRSYLIPETGATYVLRLDSRSVIKQYVTLRDLGITNPNSVANCYGLYLQGTNVSSTNDFHLFQNLYIGQSVVGGIGFLKGFYCTGRMIWSRLIGVDVSFNTGKGWHFATDNTTPAFNSNQFIGCTGLSNVQEGFLSTGQSTYNQMMGCVFETNNTANVAGTAEMQLHDADAWVVDGLGLEGGGGVAINTTTPLSNGIGLRLTGAYSYNMTLRGLYGSSSGCIVAVDASLIQGGSLSGSQLLPGTNGFAFAGISAAGNVESQQQFVYDCNNALSGTAQVKFTQDGNGNYAFCVQQSKGAHYITSAPTLNLLRMSRLVANPTGGSITISTITNRLPGCTLEVANIHASNTVTIAAALMNSGSSSVVAAGSSKRYLAIGFPSEGKLVEV